MTIRNLYPISWVTGEARDHWKGFMAGAELEVEGVIDIINSSYSKHCTITEDHSLRNNGREFITFPFKRERLIEAFNAIHHGGIVAFKQDQKFSERTSTHVHVNVSNLTLDQAKNMVLLYALFEPVFFSFVGDERKHNIYCVPLSHTFLPSTYSANFDTMVKSWHKYTALNIKPVSKIGTIEFRHLYGTDDVNIFSEWIDILKALYNFVEKEESFDIKQWLDNPKELFEKIFSDTTLKNFWKITSTEDLMSACLDVKMAFLPNIKEKYLPSKVKTVKVAKELKAKEVSINDTEPVEWDSTGVGGF